MKIARLLSALMVFVSMLLMAQSYRGRSPKQQTLPPLAHGSDLGLSQYSNGGGEIKAAAKQRGLPASGLGFAGAVAYGSGGQYAYSVVAADVSGDGKPDLVVANCSRDGDGCGDGDDGVVGVLLGNGDGTFQTAVTYDSGGYTPFSVAVADVNGDGKLDIVVANANSNTVGVLLGNGDGTFQVAVAYGSGGYNAYSVAVADVNGDGKPDVVVANQYVNSIDFNGTVGVLLGNGDGTFQPVVSYGSGGNQAYTVAVADVDGDGKPDLVVANTCVYECGSYKDGLVGVLLGNGDGTFQTAITYDSGGYVADSVAVADVNGDGKPDVVVANQCPSDESCNNGLVGVLLGNGDGTFQTVVSYSSGGISGCSVVIKDVNGDGNADLVVANSCADNTCNNGSVGVLLGNGDGTFLTAEVFGSGGYNSFSVTVADVSADGKPDVVVANCGSTTSCANGRVGVLINASISGTTTTLASSPNPSSFGQSVTFTATVVPERGFYKGTPTGSATFYDAAVSMGSANLNGSGVATFSTGTLIVGTHSITATYNGDSNFASSTSQPLSQVVQGAIAVISPNSLSFGNQTVGIASSPQKVTLMNAGNIALTVSIGITGNFSQANTCGTMVVAGGSCIVSVTFTPDGTGALNGTLNFTDNAPNSPQSVSLAGVGVVPAVTFSPTSLTFPTQVVYSMSKVQKIKLTNTGLGILKISSGGLSGQFGATTTCNGTLKSSAICTISVTFKPRSKGTLNGDITVTDNAPDSPQKVPLTGVGTYVLLSPLSVNFGTQPVNTTSQPKYISFTNKGSGTVNFTGAGISITGTYAGDFVETNNCGNSVASGANCKIKVTFTPSTQGTRAANVSISDDGGGTPQTVPLTGIGTP